MKNWEGDFITACYLSNDKQLFHLLLVVLLTLITLQGNSQCVYNYGSTLNLTNITIHRDLVKWRIPIVFHVLHNKEVENISDSLIISQIKSQWNLRQQEYYIYKFRLSTI